MKLNILGIRDAGSIDKERIIFLVDGEGDLGQFITAVSIVNNNSMSAGITDVLWFPDQTVNDGDLIVLYTKSGQKRSVDNKDTSKSWFFYRGLHESLFSETNKCAIVFQLSNWSSSAKHLQ